VSDRYWDEAIVARRRAMFEESRISIGKEAVILDMLGGLLGRRSRLSLTAV